MTEPRTLPAHVRDLIASRSAQRQYRMEARRLERLADEEAAKGRTLRAMVRRHQADIAKGAAHAEWFDPEPRP